MHRCLSVVGSVYICNDTKKKRSWFYCRLSGRRFVTHDGSYGKKKEIIIIIIILLRSRVVFSGLCLCRPRVVRLSLVQTEALVQLTNRSETSNLRLPSPFLSCIFFCGSKGKQTDSDSLGLTGGRLKVTLISILTTFCTHSQAFVLCGRSSVNPGILKDVDAWPLGSCRR